jgi:hypothetical protein
MSDRESQILETGRYFGENMRVFEAEDLEILSCLVPRSHLQEVIHNPIDSGIDEA